MEVYTMVGRTPHPPPHRLRTKDPERAEDSLLNGKEVIQHSWLLEVVRENPGWKQFVQLDH